MFISSWHQWLKKLRARKGTRCECRFANSSVLALEVEALEDRITPGGITGPASVASTPDFRPLSGPLMFDGGFAPAGIQKAYGIDQLVNQGNAGAGATIALITAFDNPAFSSSGAAGFATSDLHYFDQQFSLPDPVFLKLAQDGSTNYPGQDPSFPPNDWEGEQALDVEWAHAVAPAAKIILVECNSDSDADLAAGAKWAATPVARGGGGAMVVSMSFGTDGGETNETSQDANFSPSTYPGVTFVASTGDNGTVNNQGDYPADSPYVVAVGGTTLTVAGDGSYSSESVWNGGRRGGATGGGISNFESQPVYQHAAEPSQTMRTTPDVAFLANPSTGVAVYDSFNGGGGLDSTQNFAVVGGTSLAAPCWAGLIAIADGIRANQAVPEPPLTGATQTLPMLYSIYGSTSYHQDFHDITAGGNGKFNAAVGYDLVTGIGTPIANNLVPALADVNQLFYTALNGTNSFLLQVNGANLDLYDNGVLVASNPVSQTTSVSINGAKDNSLTVDASGLPASLSVTFDGGSGALAHTVSVENGSFTNETYTYSGAGGGAINLDGASVTFTHVTSSANTTTGANIIFDLPIGAQASLEANGTSNNTVVGTGFVASAFNNPAKTLTINTAGSGSLVALAAMGANFSPDGEIFSGQAGDIFQLQNSLALPLTASVTINTATLDLLGSSPTIDGLSGNGTITDGVGTASTLNIGSHNGNGVFAGVISDGTGSIALNKSGNGSQTLSGANTYTGTSTVAGGILEVDGSIESSVTVLNSATLDGTGAAGPVSVQSGGTLFSGTALASLSTGALSLAAGSTFVVAVDSDGKASQANVLSDPVSLAGANLVFSGNSVPLSGQAFTILKNNGNQPITGTFNGLPEGAVIPNFLGSDFSATISYVGGGGNDIVVSFGQGATTSTTVSVSSGTVPYGQAVTLTAVVSATSATPVGSVEFFDQTTGVDLGAGVLASSTATSATWVYTTTPTQIQATGASADDIKAVFTPTVSMFSSSGLLAGGLTVTPVTLTVSNLTANNKIYDRTTAATLNTANAVLVGVLDGDDVTLNANGVSAAFVSQDVGTSIPVAVSGLTLSGARATDYTLIQPTLAGDIAPASLTVIGVTANDKVYDATTTATLNTSNATLAGVISGDTVTLVSAGATATFAGKNANSNIAVSVSGLAIGGAQAADYTLMQPTLSASITPAPVTVVGIMADKVYDATTHATPNISQASLVGVLGGDTVALDAHAATGRFVSRDVGTNITVVLSGLTLTGPQAVDYIVMLSPITANITPAPVTVTGLTADDKVYDSTTLAVLNTSNAHVAGTVGGDYVVLSAAGATGTFASKDVGNSIVVTVSGLALADARAFDYALTQPTTAANIAPAPLTVTGIVAKDKVYDGTTQASLDASAAQLTGTVFSGDTVALDTSGAIGTFASGAVGNNIAVTISGLKLTGAQAGDYSLTQPTTSANITAGAVTHFAISIPGSATAGSPVSFTVTALDQFNNPSGSYTGAVHFSSTDDSAALPSDGALPGGTGTFSATLNTLGPETITVSVPAAPGITGTSNLIAVSPAATQLAVSAPAIATAGTPFLVTVAAQDDGGHTASGYTGTVALSASGGDPILPANARLTNGVGIFIVTLKSSGRFTLSAADTVNAGIQGSSGTFVVSAGAASYFAIMALPSATTGVPVAITLTALDQYGNTATNYAGKVHFTSTDSAASLPADAALTNGVGTFQVTLNTAGNQTITASDVASLTTPPLMTGTSGAITTRGLVVTGTKVGGSSIEIDFSKPFDPTKLTMYGFGLTTVQDVTLVGQTNGAITGTLYLDPSNMSATFKATEASLNSFFGTNALPDDNYTLTVVSGTTNGFADASGMALDGANNAGHANYTTTFTVANGTKEVLSLPDFARGPDGANSINIPADSAGAGIPATLTNAAAVTDVTFSVTYNPALLTITGPTSGNLQLVGMPTGGVANFHYTNSTAQNGTVTLGGIVATVPNSAGTEYKAKELLTLSDITVNGAAFTGIATSAIHENAYFGDVTGNGSIDALDVAFANNVAQGSATGFGAYALLDPAIIGDVAGDISVDAGDVSALAAYVSQLPSPKIPAIPTGLTITPTGPDPTLSLGPQGGGNTRSLRANGGVINISVQLDQPRPAGSSGMTEAILVLKYDPSVLSVSSSDITLGSISSLSTGWQLTSAIDHTTGNVAITLYSTTPINTNAAGTLVNIAFRLNPQVDHVLNVPSGSVQLVNSAMVNGEHFSTQVDDAQGQYVLSPGVDYLAFGTRKSRSPNRRAHASS